MTQLPDARRCAIASSMLFSLGLFTSPVMAEDFVINGSRNVSLFPSPPTLFHPLVLNTYFSFCFDGYRPYQVEVDVDAKVVSVALAAFRGLDISPCLVPLSRETLPVEGIEEPGNYRFDFYDVHPSTGFDPFDAAFLTASIDVGIEAGGPVYQPETPQPGSTQSGVGIVRGWACNADFVEVQFDEQARIEVAYGTSRADTSELCGDDNNGYGMVFAWGLLGDGAHRMKTFIDGVEVSDVGFNVAGLGEPFVKGLEGTYELEDFPAPGESVTVQWSEAAQNFVIIGYSQP